MKINFILLLIIFSLININLPARKISNIEMIYAQEPTFTISPTSDTDQITATSIPSPTPTSQSQDIVLTPTVKSTPTPTIKTTKKTPTPTPSATATVKPTATSTPTLTPTPTKSSFFSNFSGRISLALITTISGLILLGAGFYLRKQNR